MNSCQTPLGIEILMHYCVSPVAFPRRGYDAVEEMIAGLLEEGLLQPCPDRAGAVVCTERARAHLIQLCALPFPRQAWIGFNGGEIRE